MYKTNVLVIGSEGAGAYAAIEAARAGAHVTIVTKGRFGRSGATITGGADLIVDARSCRELFDLPGDPRDSMECFFDDMIVEGKYINNQKLVEVHVTEAPVRVKEVVDWGMQITNFLHGPGHTYARSIYTYGPSLLKALKRQCRRLKVRVIEDTMVTDLLTHQGQVVGAVGLDQINGQLVTMAAGATILATGGGMRIYPVTTAPDELTGDGHAMAWRAGAELVDMEMAQFMPSCFIHPPAVSGLTFPFMIGPGVGGLDGWLLNAYGHRFMQEWDPKRMERTTRDILSIALMNEVVEGRGSPNGGAYLHFGHLPKNLIDVYPLVRKDHHLEADWTFKGFKLKGLMEQVKNGYAIEVGPASHFFMGGVRIDENGATTSPGLYAAGEVAGGVHGANRLTGNAFTQFLVQGPRAGAAAARFALSVKPREVDPQQVKALEEKVFAPMLREQGQRAYEPKRELQKLAWENVGVLRQADRLEATLARLDQMKRDVLPEICSTTKSRRYNREWIECLQVENLLTLLEAIARSAYTRTESRGAHYRKDFPHLNNAEWLKNCVTVNANGQMKVRLDPAVGGRFDLEPLTREGLRPVAQGV